MKRGIFKRRKWEWAALLAMVGIMLYALPALAVYFPDEPTNLTVSGIGTSSATLSWTDNSDDEDGFFIYRQVGDGSYTRIATTAANAATYVDHGLPVGVEIKYKVYAYNFFGQSIPSNEVTYIVPGDSIPSAPSNLTVTGSGTSATLSWTDNSDNEDGFYIDRKVGDGSYIRLTSTAADTTGYTDSGLPPGMAIKYRVKAYNTSGQSAWSNIAVYRVPGNHSTTPSAHSPSAPSDLTVTGSGSSATLSWTDNSDNEDGFYIDRLVGDGAYIRITPTAANTTSYTDSGLPPGMGIKYRVAAYNTYGQSAWSNVATYIVPGHHSTTTSTTLLFYIDADYYYVNGVRTTMDVAPVIVEGRTLLPIAYLANPLGAASAWNPQERAVTVSLGSTHIKMRIDDPFALVNGTRVPIEPGNLAVKPIILPPGRTMLPLSFIAHTLGCSVDWDPATRQVKITYPAA